MKKFWQEVVRELKSFNNALLHDVKTVSRELPYSSTELRNAHYSILSCAKTLDEIPRKKKNTLMEEYVSDIDYVLNYLNEMLIHSEYSFVDGWKLPTGKVCETECIIVSPQFINCLMRCFLFSSEYSPYPKIDVTTSALTVLTLREDSHSLEKVVPRDVTYTNSDFKMIYDVVKQCFSIGYNHNFAIVIEDFNHFMWNAINAIRGTLWVPEHTIFESWGYLNLHIAVGVPQFIKPKHNVEKLMQNLNTIQ